MAGLEMQHVPYRGMGPAVPDLLGGRVQIIFAPAVTVTPHIASGALRMIGTTGAARSSLFPDYPTIAESGLPKHDPLDLTSRARSNQSPGTEIPNRP
jgi:tripartite-type tricarboxylate transporter receptor subunit TctC